MSRDPQPDLVGYPETKAQFLAAAKFARHMADKTKRGDTKARNPKYVYEGYIAKAEEYERMARAM